MTSQYKTKRELFMNGQDRLYSRKWGVFTHYLYGTPSLPEAVSGDADWNRRVDSVDVKRLAETLHRVGAGYYFITLMQGRKYMLGPNATFDRIAGTKPSEACSRRDLVLELAHELQGYGIDLYLYYTGDGPYMDEAVARRFGFTEPRDHVTADFVSKWADVLKEYAVRYGELVKGWWIDGCYGEQFHYTQELLEPYYDAVKAGNPDAILACNNGVKTELQKWFRREEFTCGEFEDFLYIPKARFIDGAQAHILAPLGISKNGHGWGAWAETGCKRSAEHVIEYVKRVNAAGGVVTLDVKIHDDGSFEADQLELLSRLGEAVPTR